MTVSAFEPLQQLLQLCILHLKLARQLVPEKSDFFVEIDCIVKSCGSAWRRLDNDCNGFRFFAPHAPLLRLTFAKSKGGFWCSMRGCIGLIEQGRGSRFYGSGAFDICRVVNNACRFFGTMRVHGHRLAFFVNERLLVGRTIRGFQPIVGRRFSRLGAC